MDPLTIVPLATSDYRACWVVPGDWRQAWPNGYGDAIVLELEPEGPHRFTYTSHQTWPADASRYASTLGHELAISRSGVPIATPALLGFPDQGWHHLTLAFGNDLSVPSLADWSNAREVILNNLAPEHWPAPDSCDALLHVGDTEYLLLLVRNQSRLRSWVGHQVGLRFSDLTPEQTTAVAERFLDAALGLGVRVEGFEQTRHGLHVVGRWGRGRHTLLRAGTETGGAFRVDL
jgi:hypothetical protein